MRSSSGSAEWTRYICGLAHPALWFWLIIMISAKVVKDFPRFSSPSNGSYKHEVLYKMGRILACSRLSVRRDGTREHLWLKKRRQGQDELSIFNSPDHLRAWNRLVELPLSYNFFFLVNRVFLEKFASQSLDVFIGIQTIKSPEFGHVTNVDPVQPTCNPCSAFTWNPRTHPQIILISFSEASFEGLIPHQPL